MVVVWSSSLSIDIIATAPSDNTFVSKSRGGIKGSPMSRHKWQKMAKNGKKWQKMTKNSISRLMTGKWSGNSLEKVSIKA